MKFEFKKKKDKYYWENDEIRLRFSKPDIQAKTEYTPINNETEILYYYYTVDVFYKEAFEWKKIYHTFVSDFLGIFDLKWMLNQILNEKNKVEDAGTWHFENGEKTHYHFYPTVGFAYEDYYEITHTFHDSEEFFMFYIGVKPSYEPDIVTMGIKIERLTREDLKELFQCVNEFINYSIYSYNEQIKKSNKLYSSNMKIKHNKLFVYEVDETNDKIKKQFSVFVKGDEIDFYYLGDKEERHENIIIKDIKENLVISSDNKNFEISKIPYINLEVDKSKLTYGVKEIAIDFLEILDNEEKEEFRTKKVKDLLKKYKFAIIGRTWMCRDEHNFSYKKTGHPQKDIVPIVKKVIKTIKEELKK